MAKAFQGGMIAASVTPRRAREDSIDLAAALEMTDFLHKGGVDAIALLTWTGEFFHFALEDRARMLDFAVKRSRLPVLVNVAHSTLDGVLQLGQEANSSGVAGILVMPPYWDEYDQAAMIAFCSKAGEELAKEARVFLCAGSAHFGLQSDSIAELMNTGMFAGVWCTGGRWNSGRAFLAFGGDGSEYVAARANSGLDGCVSELAGAVPELMARLDRAILSGETDLVRRLEPRVAEFRQQAAGLPATAALKEALRQRKVSAGVLAGPLGTEGERRLAAFGDWFRNWWTGVRAECK